jgi:hypothetical protein
VTPRWQRPGGWRSWAAEEAALEASGRRIRLGGPAGSLEQLDPGLEVTGLKELGRREAGADEDASAGDRVL